MTTQEIKQLLDKAIEKAYADFQLKTINESITPKQLFEKGAEFSQDLLLPLVEALEVLALPQSKLDELNENALKKVILMDIETARQALNTLAQKLGGKE